MTLTKLTVSCPQALAEPMTEFLLDCQWAKGGFTTLTGSGHGVDFATASLRERVRGRVQVVLVMMILPAGDVAPLLAALRAQFRAPHVRYWIEPIQELGNLS